MKNGNRMFSMSGIDRANASRGAARWFGTPAALVYCTAAVEMWEVSGSQDGLAACAAAVADYLFVSSAALWLIRDAKRAARPLPYDAASFLFLGFPLVPLIYLFLLHRFRGFGVIGRAFLLGAAGVVAVRVPFGIAQLYLNA